MLLKLKKQQVEYEWTSGWRERYTMCSINNITIDKRLESAHNSNPDLRDLELCVKRRNLPPECLGESERILQFFNGVKVGEMTILITP